MPTGDEARANERKVAPRPTTSPLSLPRLEVGSLVSARLADDRPAGQRPVVAVWRPGTVGEARGIGIVA